MIVLCQTAELRYDIRTSVYRCYIINNTTVYNAIEF